jgi:hypothetical protein
MQNCTLPFEDKFGYVHSNSKSFLFIQYNFNLPAYAAGSYSLFKSYFLQTTLAGGKARLRNKIKLLDIP